MKPTAVLHVEDDPNDAFLLKHALRKAELPLEIQHVSDGQQAIDYLSGTGAFSDRANFPLPRLVLLDLKLPLLNGFEVLAWARSRSDFLSLPVFVLSSSDLPEDISEAKRLGANDFFVKTHTFEDVIQAMKNLAAFFNGRAN
jgi:CheY-like chemotaxis protein